MKVHTSRVILGSLVSTAVLFLGACGGDAETQEGGAARRFILRGGLGQEEMTVFLGTHHTYAIDDVATHGYRSCGPLSEVSADDEQVFQVSAVDFDQVTLFGATLGSSALNFSGLGAGALQKDVFDVRVVEPKHLALSGDECERYLRADTISVPFYFEGARDESGYAEFIGGGAGLYPVEVEPEGALVLSEEASTEDYFVFEVSKDAPEEVMVSSTLAAHAGGKHVKFGWAELDEIARIVPSISWHKALDPGVARELEMIAYDARGRRVCGDFPLQVNVLRGDTDRCLVDVPEKGTGGGRFTLRGMEPGRSCQLSMVVRGLEHLIVFMELDVKDPDRDNASAEAGAR